MAEKGSFYRKTLAITAGLGTLAMLANPASYQNTVTLDIPDGEREPISSDPDRLSLTSRRRGGVLVEFRNLSYDTFTPLYVGTKDDKAGIYVPGTVVLQGSKKVHEITVTGRNTNDTGSVVEVKDVCPKNAPSK